MLLLPGSLLAQLTHDLLPKPCGFSEDFIQPVEHLFQIVRADWGRIRHSCRKDYGMLAAA
jgi:hypothetical protein